MPVDKTSEAICTQVARLLKEEREERGLSISVVAQRAGLAWQAVKFVEDELRNPTLDTLVRITLALEVDLETIISRACKAAAAKAQRLPRR